MKTLALVAMLAVAAPTFAADHGHKADKMAHDMKAEMVSTTAAVVSGTEAAVEAATTEATEAVKDTTKKAH